MKLNIRRTMFLRTNTIVGGSIEIKDRQDVIELLLVVKRGLNTLEPPPPSLVKLHDDLVAAL